MHQNNSLPPLVSVVIATRNRSALLLNTIEKLKAQTYKNFEILIIDDCSEDSTWSLLEDLQSRYSFIRAFRLTKNLGPGAARNLGIRESKGIYIAIQDDDDFSLPERLELQANLLQNHPDISLVFSPVLWVDKDGNEIGIFPGAVGKGLFPKDPEDVFRLLFLQSNKIPNTAVMFRKEVFERIGGYPETPWVGEDWLLFMKMAAAGCRFLTTKKPLVHQLRGPGRDNLMSRPKYAFQSQTQVLQLIITWLRDKGLESYAALYPKALANQKVREARALSGFSGLLMIVNVLLTDPGNSLARESFGILLKRALMKAIRPLGLNCN